MNRDEFLRERKEYITLLKEIEGHELVTDFVDSSLVHTFERCLHHSHRTVFASKYCWKAQVSAYLSSVNCPAILTYEEVGGAVYVARCEKMPCEHVEDNHHEGVPRSASGISKPKIRWI
jgi:hypothetical protein